MEVDRCCNWLLISSENF